MKRQKYYRVLYLYDHLNHGDTIYTQGVANLFEVDKRTVQRDINDIRCYYSDCMAAFGYGSANSIIYDRNKGGYILKNIA